MEMPNVDNIVRDSESGVAYNIKAYRSISEGEAIAVIQQYIRQSPRRPKQSSQVTIVTVIGCADFR